MLKLQPLLYSPVRRVQVQQVRHLWEYINIMFNRVDAGRLKQFGPDRTCAEWVLRNGGAVRFTDSKEYLRDYNMLPPEGTKLAIKSVDASDSAIMHHGFEHFIGCKQLDKIILHQCSYLYDKALEDLKPISGTLHHLQVTSCNNISRNGLLHLTNLQSLNTLVLSQMTGVKDLDEVIKELRQQMPQCNISTL